MTDVMRIQVSKDTKYRSHKGRNKQNQIAQRESYISSSHSSVISATFDEQSDTQCHRVFRKHRLAENKPIATSIVRVKVAIIDTIKREKFQLPSTNIVNRKIT